jgi:hypothetical protein
LVEDGLAVEDSLAVEVPVVADFKRAYALFVFV